ncbi:MAG: esterase-like activity of phytase family protein [Bacteroides sp.]|nr:esterase-like activity of phytase family protein [Roseburia sp.]MCM1345846.1 esterase-like activity of phytase family protein [Bacteroides sp.]MCM1420236.1 esterase-like activity of phytase family protein [Bacteroides sp.]
MKQVIGWVLPLSLCWAGLGMAAAYSQTISEVSVLKQVSISNMGVLPANYSGITYMGGDKYAVVDDKWQGGGISFLDIAMSRYDGKITGVSQRFVSDSGELHTGKSRDCEGIAFCRETATLFVCGEAEQDILEYNMSGEPTGRKMSVPESLGKENTYPNLGFESLTYNQHTRLFWTTTESVLKSDGQPVSALSPNERNILRLQSFGTDLKPAGQYAYRMEAPGMKKKQTKMFVYGVSDMAALDDGRLIVMEREMCVMKRYIGSYCTVRLFIVKPMEYAEIETDTDVRMLSADRFLDKELLCEFTTHLNFRKMNLANYEGLCLGPKLDDGRLTILLLNDSQKAAGNALKRLKEYLKVIVVRL